MVGLNERQSLFVQEYLKDLNGTQAAIRAGYSEASARSIGSENLAKPHIQEAITLAMQERSKRVQVSQDDVLRELLKIATSDIRKLFDSNGALLKSDQWPDDVAPAIASVEVDEIFDGFGENRVHIGYTKKVKFWDKPKALELVGRHLGMFKDDGKSDAPKKPLVLKYAVSDDDESECAT